MAPISLRAKFGVNNKQTIALYFSTEHEERVQVFPSALRAQKQM